MFIQERGCGCRSMSALGVEGWIAVAGSGTADSCGDDQPSASDFLEDDDVDAEGFLAGVGGVIAPTGIGKIFGTI